MDVSEVSLADVDSPNNVDATTATEIVPGSRDVPSPENVSLGLAEGGCVFTLAD